ncbi:hypothetical protein [Shimia aestuarii]|uniref:hypothetical protein n=1 Tax=Shimia aestuarii TaxID=254406 RepID=UPI001FB33338|nr:hypothetical protein [Shimia aestuarii]
MKVILFIGHHKVGSTALQDFLSRNQVALMKSGILYPSTDFQGMSLALGTAAGLCEPPKDIPLNAREPHNALAFRMLSSHKLGKVPPFHTDLPGLPQMKQALQQQIQFLKPHTVILASEVFSNFARGGAPIIEDLIDVFPVQAEITIIATLRRIDEYLASWHGQRLKFGHELSPLRQDGIDEYFDGIHFDYRDMLQCWLETVPEARFVIRDYAEVRANGGSVTDFFAQAGVDLPPDLVSERRSNRSLHRGVYEIARLGNRALPPPQAQLLRETLRRMTPELDLPPSHDIELFGAENRARLQERFVHVQDYLAEITGKAPFFANADAVATPCPVPEMEIFPKTVKTMNARMPRLGIPKIRKFLRELEDQEFSPTARTQDTTA